MSNRRAQSMPAQMLDQKPTRGRCVAAICFSWKIITCIVSHVTLVLLVVSYCVGGAYLFRHLEKPHEIEVKKGIESMRYSLTDKIWKFSENASVLSELDWINNVKIDLANFEKQILTAMKTDGWDGDEDVTKSQWTFAGSLFYSIIVITTIGYGHISPRTDWGKVTTIFYAIVGIPLMLLCLSNIGDVLATSFRFIYWRICCYVCTRRPRRPRNRSVRGHRYSSRSQPPPMRRSMRLTQRSANDSGVGASIGLAHAHSDPELAFAGRNDEHDIEYGQRFHSSHRRRQPHYAPITRMSVRHKSPYNDEPYFDRNPHETQTLNRSSRFSSRQRNRDRMRDRHTVERERNISRSKQQLYSMDDINLPPPTAKRAQSVRSVRSPNSRQEEIVRESRERELNRLNTNSMPRGRSVPNSGRGRAKSVDPRASTRFEQIDEDIVRKTPIISNRYAIDELEHRQKHNKNNLRSQSMPRSAHQKHNFDNHDPPNGGVRNQNQNHHQHSQHRHHSPYPNQQRRHSLGRQNSGQHSRYGNHLELPELSAPHNNRNRRERSPRYGDYVEEEYDRSFTDEYDVECGYGDYDDYPSAPKRNSRDRKPRRERAERLAPRIMSPMGFAVARQVRRRPSYDYDDDSMYGDDASDYYYGDVSPKDRPVPIWLCVFLVISYILGGASLFAHWEKWSYLDSAYFCFITLTTIGFGDFVPAKGVKDESEQSIAYCSLYLLFGISLLAMSFNLVQEEFIANVKEVARRLGILKDEDRDEDD
ncbi:uncharacterized protein LOC119673472 [Teleopsis dalmanni]|uniref:uncharacterized protein LOC119673472 n=1 Tax=Teleopsis dalmanni TaxID=139649 RepID=UPI0018CDDF33|nr:uncharacterized protein LOC119673472 [Teleopsis dalmanni]